MSSLVYIPIDGERKLAQGNEYIVSNYRLIQYDRGSKTSVSLPLHIIKEYKLTSNKAMFKVVNGIVNVIGKMPKREELRSALSMREFDSLKVGDQRKLCEMSSVPFVHERHPYNHWTTIGYHRKFSLHFYRIYAWIKGEEVFTYYPDSFILTNYRLYQRDSRENKLYIFPMHWVHTFEAKKNELEMECKTGEFKIRGRVPRQDHLLRVWQARAWDTVPDDHLDWLVRPYDYIKARHPLSQYDIQDYEKTSPMAKATETEEEMQVTSGSQASGTVFVKPVIKDKCSHCGAPLSWQEIDWVGPDQYECPNCGATHRVDYVRM
ncbi:MAG: hypothetical protein GF309_05630 [Candidatus Lokiarchaeota archaeon]|nr:hypothetical protein [Candidatus Lokiarchaeota archaeon]